MLLDIVEKWTAIWSILILISKLMTNFCNGLYVVNIYQTDDKQFAKWILSYKKIRVQYTYYVTIPRWSPTLLKSIPSLKSEFWSQIYAPFFTGFELNTELSDLKILVKMGPDCEMLHVYWIFEKLYYEKKFLYRSELYLRTSVLNIFVRRGFATDPLGSARLNSNSEQKTENLS